MVLFELLLENSISLIHNGLVYLNSKICRINFYYGIVKQLNSLLNVSFSYLKWTLDSCTGFRQSNQRLELPYCNPIGRLLDLKLISPHPLVNLNQKLFCFWCYFGVNLSSEREIPKHRSMVKYLRSIFDFEGISIGSHILMHRHDSLSNSHINSLSAVISHNEKDVESRHQRRTQSDVRFEIFGLVVSSHDWIHCC